MHKNNTLNKFTAWAIGTRPEQQWNEEAFRSFAPSHSGRELIEAVHLELVLRLAIPSGHARVSGIIPSGQLFQVFTLFNFSVLFFSAFFELSESFQFFFSQKSITILESHMHRHIQHFLWRCHPNLMLIRNQFFYLQRWFSHMLKLTSNRKQLYNGLATTNLHLIPIPISFYFVSV